MIIISAVAKQRVSYRAVGVYKYHSVDLLRRSAYDNLLAIYEPANHLYVDKLLKMKLEQKSFTRLILEQLKITENDEIFSRIIKYLQQNLQQVQDFRTISTMMVLLYRKKYEGKQFILKLAKRGFVLLKCYQLYKIPLQGYSYTIARFIISLQKLIPLQMLTDEQFNCINPQRIKPLFNVFILQIMYKNNLQQKYTFPKHLLQILHKNRQFIPYSDLHHMTHTKKLIKNAKYTEIVDFMYNKLKKKMRSEKEEGMGKNRAIEIQEDVVKKMYEEYYQDLANKYL